MTKAATKVARHLDEHYAQIPDRSIYDLDGIREWFCEIGFTPSPEAAHPDEVIPTPSPKREDLTNNMINICGDAFVT